MHASHSQLLLGGLKRSSNPTEVVTVVADAGCALLLGMILMLGVAFAVGFAESQAMHLLDSILLRTMHASHSHSLALFLN